MQVNFESNAIDCNPFLHNLNQTWVTWTLRLYTDKRGIKAISQNPVHEREGGRISKHRQERVRDPTVLPRRKKEKKKKGEHYSSHITLSILDMQVLRDRRPPRSILRPTVPSMGVSVIHRKSTRKCAYPSAVVGA